MFRRQRLLSQVFVLVSLVLGGTSARAQQHSYLTDVEAWRQKHEESLKKEDGWLSVVGLHWLPKGESTLGSDPTSDVLLPPGAPATVGTLILDGDHATFRAAPGVKITLAGKPFALGTIRSDANEQKPDVLSIGDIRLILLRRGKRDALRVKDNRSDSRVAFAGLRWYPIDPTWKIHAKFVPAPANTRLVLDTIVGEQEVTRSPGYVTFERAGKTYKLQAAEGTDGELWIVFRDGTSGRTTAGSARQLETPAPKEGAVILDFNKASNLPCSYIPFATCPIAPSQNRLSLPITAGEMKYDAASKPLAINGKPLR